MGTTYDSVSDLAQALQAGGRGRTARHEERTGEADPELARLVRRCTWCVSAPATSCRHDQRL